MLHRSIRRAVVAGAAGLAAVALLGCSTPSAAADQRAALVRDSASAIGRYVGDLQRGDLAGANGLRCKAAQLPAPEQEAFLAPVVDQMKSALGSLHVERVDIVDAVDGQVHLRVQLQGAPGPVYPALIREGGQLRLCGASIDGAAVAMASEKTRGGSDAHSTVTLADVVAVTPIAGYEPVPGDSVPPSLLDQLDGYQDAHGAQWAPDGGSGPTVSITALDLDTPAHAEAAQAVLEREVSDSVTGLFETGSDGARSFRYLAGYQLLLQPPGIGPVADYVGFRWGSRVVAIFVVPLTAADDHSVALAAASAIQKAAEVR